MEYSRNLERYRQIRDMKIGCQVQRMDQVRDDLQPYWETEGVVYDGIIPKLLAMARDVKNQLIRLRERVTPGEINVRRTIESKLRTINID